MARITIRDLDEDTKERLRVRAAQHKCSMEEEARRILRAAVAQEVGPAPNLSEAIRRRFRPFAGVELTIPARQAMREPPERKR